MKLINIILGIATLLIIASLVNLGIKAFHPEPKNPYMEGISKAVPYPREFNCAKDDMKCIEDRDAFYVEQQKINEENMEKDRAYQEAMRVWNRDFFIAANLVGILIFLVAFTLIMRGVVGQAGYSVAIGTMAAGLWSIIFGYMRGWDSVDDKTKFIIGLGVAILVIGGSVWLMSRHYKKDASASA